MTRLEVRPQVSIMTPVYNGSEYIEELVLSVQAQDYSQLEHIIIDDGSEDGGATAAILKKYPRLNWWSRANRGQYATMNEGLKAAKGDLICFVSADDLLCPDAVQSAVNYLRDHPDCDGVYGNTRLIQADGRDSDVQPPFAGWPFNLYPYLSHVSHCSLYIWTQPLRNLSLFFNESYLYSGDYEWMTRLVLAGMKIGFINKTLSMVRMHENQATQKHRAQMVYEKNAIVKSHHLYNWKYRFLAFLYFFNVADQKVRYSFRNIGIKGGFDLISDWVMRKIGKKR